MKIKATQLLAENDVLAKPIYNEQGQYLLNSGVSLTCEMIEKLKSKGIQFVYIEDPQTHDIYVDTIISDKVRQRSSQAIKKSFDQITNHMTLGKTINLDEFSSSFTSIIRNILNDMKSNKEAISLLTDVYLHDTYIYQHSLNVAIYSLALGRKIGFNDRQLEEIGLGAMLHDIGKLGVPINVLNKKEQLLDEEFQLIKEHSTIGFDMIRKTHTISLQVAHCAYQHHERLNGSGYPRGIKEDEIHIYAKIIGICDVFDAITGNRVYRKAKLPHEGLELLYSGVDQLFDKELVEAFAKTVAIYPNGLEVTLSDGKKGIVCKQNGEFTSRPVIKVLEENGQKIEAYELDLMKKIDTTIVECETALTQSHAS